MDNSEKLAKLGTQNEDKKNHNAICVGHYQAFELIRPENYSALCKSGLKQMRPWLINAASVKNDVYLWIYTIKRHM